MKMDQELAGNLPRNYLSVERLQLLVEADFERGLLFWKHRAKEEFSSNRVWKSFEARFAGKPCGSYLASDGYYRATIDRTGQLVHRVVWALYHGQWSRCILDHRDNVTTNNCISNLRESTSSLNQANSVSKVGSSAYKGVHWCNTSRRWVAKLVKDRERVLRKSFATEVEAAMAYDSKAIEVFGDHAKTNAMVREVDEKGEKVLWTPPKRAENEILV